MEKKFITETIFRKQDNHNPIMFGEINIELQPNDVIMAGHDDGYYYLEVHRDRLETDEEFEKRKEREEQGNIEMIKRRYEYYLKLKKEFERHN
jgi:hypothetical protein